LKPAGRRAVRAGEAGSASDIIVGYAGRSNGHGYAYLTTKSVDTWQAEAYQLGTQYPLERIAR
jgi:hypothetical protein